MVLSTGVMGDVLSVCQWDSMARMLLAEVIPRKSGVGRGFGKSKPQTGWPEKQNNEFETQ